MLEPRKDSMASEPAESNSERSRDRAVESEPLLAGQDVFNTSFRLFVNRREISRETDE